MAWVARPIQLVWTLDSRPYCVSSSIHYYCDYKYSSVDPVPTVTPIFTVSFSPIVMPYPSTTPTLTVTLTCSEIISASFLLKHSEHITALPLCFEELRLIAAHSRILKNYFPNTHVPNSKFTVEFTTATTI